MSFAKEKKVKTEVATANFPSITQPTLNGADINISFIGQRSK